MVAAASGVSVLFSCLFLLGCSVPFATMSTTLCAAAAGARQEDRSGSEPSDDARRRRRRRLLQIGDGDEEDDTSSSTATANPTTSPSREPTNTPTTAPSNAPSLDPLVALAAATEDGNVLLWSYDNDAGLFVDLGPPIVVEPQNALVSLAFSPNYASASTTATALLLATGGATIDNGTEMCTVQVLRSAEGTFDDTVTVKGRHVDGNEALTSDGLVVWEVAFSSDGALLAWSCLNTVVLWDVVGNFSEVATIMSDDGEEVYTLAWSPDDDATLAVGSAGGVIGIWNATSSSSPSHVTSLNASDSILSLCFSPDGRHLVSGAIDGVLLVWSRLSTDLYELKQVNTEGTFAATEQSVFYSTMFSPDSSMLAASFGNEVLLIDARNTSEFTLVSILEAHDDVVLSVQWWYSRWSNSSNMLASGSNDGNIKLWNVSALAMGSEEELEITPVHIATLGTDSPVWSIAFTPGQLDVGTTFSAPPSAIPSNVPSHVPSHVPTDAPSGAPTTTPAVSEIDIIAANVEQLLVTGNVSEAVGVIIGEAIQSNSGGGNESSALRMELVVLLGHCLHKTNVYDEDDKSETLTSIAVALEAVVGVPSEVDTLTTGNSIALVKNLIASAVNVSNATAKGLITEESNFTSATVGSVSQILEASVFSSTATSDTQENSAAESARALTSALESLSVAQQQALLQQQDSAARWLTVSNNVILISTVLLENGVDDDGASPVASTISFAAGEQEEDAASFTIPLAGIATENGSGGGACGAAGVVGGASGISFASDRSPYRWQPNFELRTAVSSLTLYNCAGHPLHVAGLSEEDSLVVTLKKDDGGSTDAGADMCAWWNSEKQTWDDSGCELISSSNDAIVSCSCNHLTAFAIVHLIPANENGGCVGDGSAKWQELYDGPFYDGFLVAMTSAWTLAVAVAFRAALVIRKAPKHGDKTPFSFFVNANLVPVSMLRVCYFAILATSGGSASSRRCLEFSQADSWAVPALHDGFLVPFWSVFVMVLCCWSDLCSGPLRRQTGFLSDHSRRRLLTVVFSAILVTIVFSVLIGSDVFIHGNDFLKQWLAWLEILLFGTLSLVTAISFLLVGRRVTRALQPKATQSSRNGAAAAVARIATRCAFGFVLHTLVLWSIGVLIIYNGAPVAVLSMVLFSVGIHVVEIALVFFMLRAVRPSVTAAWKRPSSVFRRISVSIVGFLGAQLRRMSTADSKEQRDTADGESVRQERSSSSLSARIRAFSSGMFAMAVRRPSAGGDEESNATTVDLSGRHADVGSEMTGASIRLSELGTGELEMNNLGPSCTHNPLARDGNRAAK